MRCVWDLSTPLHLIQRVHSVYTSIDLTHINFALLFVERNSILFFFQLTFVRHWHFLHILLCVCISHWMLCIFTALKQIVSFEKIYTIFSVGSVVTVFLASNRICILTCPREGSEVMCVCVCEVQTRENDKYSPHHHSHVHKDYISKTHGNRRVCA